LLATHSYCSRFGSAIRDHRNERKKESYIMPAAKKRKAKKAPKAKKAKKAKKKRK